MQFLDLLAQLPVDLLEMTDLMFERLHVSGDRGINAAQALPGLLLKFLVNVHPSVSALARNYRNDRGRSGAPPAEPWNALWIGLDGEPCAVAVTLGRFLALFAAGVIAAIVLQQAWLWWPLGAAAVWALLRLVRP